MLTCYLRGGLGNQLFQILTTLICSLVNNVDFYFLESEVLYVGSPRATYWKDFLIEFSLYLKSKHQPNTRMIKEKGFHYTDISKELEITEDTKNGSYHTCLNGYFQSYKYFDKHYSFIYSILNLKEKKEKVMEKIVLKFDLSKTVSMHFRAGDYYNLQQIHPIQSFSYYQEALDFVIKNDTHIKTVYYFREIKDAFHVSKYIKALQNTFPKLYFIPVNDNLLDWEQMLMMSNCKHNIIANSTFSWWGAYFNTNESKIVCYPNKWFGPQGPQNTNDMCPPSWIRIGL